MTDGGDIYLVYDGQCPACSYYCHTVRIRESVGNLLLIDARQPSEHLDKVTAAGLDIDQGMVLIVGEQMYCGADVIHALAIMGTRSGMFNRVTYRCFRSRTVSKFVYPMLRAGRNLLLKMLSRTSADNLNMDHSERF